MANRLYSTAISTIAGNLTAIATTINLKTGTGLLFTVPVAGDWEMATLHSATAREVVKITNRTGDVLTVVRGQENTTAAAWPTLSDIFAHVTIREQIISKFTARAAALSDLPVLRAQRSIGESDERFVSVWDGEDQAIELQYNLQKMQFPLAIECIVKTTDHSSEANNIIGEIIALMIGTNRTFDGLALKTELAVASPSYPQDGGNYTMVTVIFNITYETVLGDPYTQKTN